MWFGFPGWFIHSSRRSYYLFFNYLSYYLYMLSVYAGTKGAVLPVYAEMGLKRVTRICVENSLESHKPVEISVLRASDDSVERRDTRSNPTRKGR